MCCPLYSEKAPSLKKFAGEHLEADQYHEAMKDPETVIIDVRNAYESAIGNFQPPKGKNNFNQFLAHLCIELSSHDPHFSHTNSGGAKLIDPKMRNSVEFPKWLNSAETQKQLTGKKVLMYCTGGIRCERATALLNQMSTVQEDLKPKGVYHCRGGIERYVKTFPQGGYWKGKNYLFDRRMEQTPDVKGDIAVENDIVSKCCLCKRKWTQYRGQYKCNRSLCRVPVIVCDSCVTAATAKPETLVCDLCTEGYRAPSEMPDLVSMKRKAEEIVQDIDNVSGSPGARLLSKKPKKYHKDRLFLKRVPLTASFTKIKEALGSDKVERLKWLTDKDSGGFYGSCIVSITKANDLKLILDRSTSQCGIRIEKKKIKIGKVFEKSNEDTFKDFVQKEYPPIGIIQR